jgi:hypothetical protein
MNEFQIRALFENRFGNTPEAFGLTVETNERGTYLTGKGHTLELRVVNEQQAGWYLDGAAQAHCETPPAVSVLKPNDSARQSNGNALSEALA